MKPSLFLKLLRTIKNVSKKKFYQCYILGLLDGVLASVILILMSKFFDAVTAFASGKGTGKTAVLCGILFFFIKIMAEIVNGYSNYCGDAYYYRSVLKITELLNEKCAKVPAIKLEDTDYLDKMDKAYAGAGEARNFVNTVLNVVFLYIPYIVVMAGYLMLQSPMLVSIVIIVFICMGCGQWIRGKISIETEELTANMNRRADEYERSFLNKSSIKDTRTLGAEFFFLKLFEKTLNQIYKVKKDSFQKKNRLEICTEFIYTVGYLLAIVFMFFSLIRGELSIGSFAALFYALDNLFLMVGECMEECQEYGTDAIGRIKNLLEFLYNEDEKMRDETEEKDNIMGICVKDMSFTYPNGKEVIHSLTFDIKKGETIAVVGRNGAGKSTLVRLLLGLYSPDEGKVEREKSLQKKSAVFQKFGHYPMTVKDNIEISDTKKKIDTLESLLQKKGMQMDMKQFKNGEDTFLGREYGGEELSGGQWQKIAIARGVYRDSELICLDEPTAAIDPEQESNLYEQFHKICDGKTAILVTHRMGMVKLADRILVLKDGEIVGIDNHETLLQNCEEYQRLWNSQAVVYQD